MKKIIIILSAIVLFCAFTVVTVKYYTEEKIEVITKEAVNTIERHDFKPLDLGDVLYLNVHAFIDTLKLETVFNYHTGKDTTVWLNEYAGISTPKSYKDGVRKAVAENPQLIYLALELFKSTGVFKSLKNVY